MSERVRVHTTVLGKRLSVEVNRQKLAGTMKLYNEICAERPGEINTTYTDTPMSADTRAVMATIHNELRSSAFKKTVRVD